MFRLKHYTVRIYSLSIVLLYIRKY